MHRADVFKAEVARLVDGHNRPPCYIDGKPCFSDGRGCFSQNLGVWGDAVNWACRRLPRRKFKSEPLRWVDFERS